MNNTNPLYLLQEISTETYLKAVNNSVKRIGKDKTVSKILSKMDKSSKWHSNNFNKYIDNKISGRVFDRTKKIANSNDDLRYSAISKLNGK